MQSVLLFSGLGVGIVLFVLTLAYSDLRRKLTVSPETLWPLGGLDTRADYADAGFAPVRSLLAGGRGQRMIVTCLVSDDQRTAALATGHRQVLISSFGGKLMTTVNDGEYPPIRGELRQKFPNDRFADFYDMHTYGINVIHNHGIGSERFDPTTAPDQLTSIATRIFRPSPWRYYMHTLNPMRLRSSSLTSARIERWRILEVTP